MSERGVYQNVNRGRQLIRFDGLRYGNITPTDADFLIEYHNSLWLFGEVKMIGKDVPYGQELALERLVRDTSKAGKHSLAFIAEHNITDTRKDVYIKDCMLRSVFASGEKRWRTPKHPMTVKELVTAYINHYDK